MQILFLIHAVQFSWELEFMKQNEPFVV